jgi:hypothetical protein
MFLVSFDNLHILILIYICSVENKGFSMDMPIVDWPDTYTSISRLSPDDDYRKMLDFFPVKLDLVDRKHQFPAVSNDDEAFRNTLKQKHYDCILVHQKLSTIDINDSSHLINAVILTHGQPLKAVLAIRDVIDPNSVTTIKHLSSGNDLITQLNETIADLGSCENTATLLVTYHAFEVDWESGIRYILSAKATNTFFATEAAVVC